MTNVTPTDFQLTSADALLFSERERAVLSVLGRLCVPLSRQTLSDETEISTNIIWHVLQALVDRQVLTRTLERSYPGRDKHWFTINGEWRRELSLHFTERTE